MRCPNCDFYKINEFGFTKKCPKCGYFWKSGDEVDKDLENKQGDILSE